MSLTLSELEAILFGGQRLQQTIENVLSHAQFQGWTGSVKDPSGHDTKLHVANAKAGVRDGDVVWLQAAVAYDGRVFNLAAERPVTSAHEAATVSITDVTAIADAPVVPIDGARLTFRMHEHFFPPSVSIEFDAALPDGTRWRLDGRVGG